MKTRTFIFALIAATLFFYGCDKSSLDKLPTLPDLEDVDDVCTKMTDLDFMRYCYESFDVNGDAKVSMSEANAVKTISCSTAEDFTGIEYFPNLESFESYSAKYLDLRYNAKLTYIKFSYHFGGVLYYSAPIEQLDLSYCVNLTTLCSGAFYKCSNLTSIVLPSSLKEIGSYAFSGCTGLTSIELPSSLKEIGSGAFYYCTNLKTVTSRASTPPTLDDSVFGYCSSLSTLYVPSKSVKSYKNSDWAIWFTAIEAIN